MARIAVPARAGRGEGTFLLALYALYIGAGRVGWPLTRVAAVPSIQYADLYPEREESYEVDQA